MNPYEELELTSSATPEEIKAKYRSLAQIHHPDRGGDEEKFKKIKLAYEILIDPDLKKEYDSTGQINKDVTVRSEALKNLSNLTFQILPSLNPEFDDLISLMRSRINQFRDEIQNNIKVCCTFIKNLEKIISRIKYKKDGENVIKCIAESQLKVRKEELITFNKQLKIYDEMDNILEDYYYGIDDWTLFLDNGAASGNRTRDISLED